MVKAAIIFLYSTAVTVAWWIILHADALSAWLFFLLAVGIGLGLAHVHDRVGKDIRIRQILTAMGSLYPWRWRG
jgi:hypothetical protein